MRQAINWKLYSCLLVLFVCEFILFHRYVHHNIINLYPRSFDQASYLPVLYLTYENIKHVGWLLGLQQSPPLATGVLFPVQSALALFVFGASRYSLLLVNFLYFIALQICCVIALRSITKKNYMVLAFLGVLLAVNTPFFKYDGNMFDVRMDFMTFCLYGMVVCMIIRSGIYLERKWTMLAAVLACFTILLRTLTVVYFAGIILSMGAYFFFNQYNNGRLKNLILFAGLLGCVIIPLIWLNSATLYQYYVIGHVLGAEKYIRAAEVGIKNALQAFVYYPGMLFAAHIGFVSLSLAALFLAFFALLRRPTFAGDYGKTTWFFLVVAILIPMTALTLDTSKSPIVASIMVVPTLFLLFWDCLSVDNSIVLTKKGTRFFYTLSSFIFIVGMFCQVKALTHHYSQRRLNELDVLTRLYLDVGNYAVAQHKDTISIAFDQVCDYLTSGGIATLYYENTGKLLAVNVEKLGGIIFPITEDDALASLKRSDVFVLNLDEYKQPSPYPFNQSVEKIKPKLKSYAELKMQKLGDYIINDATYRVYVAHA